MSKWEAIELWAVSGTTAGITKRERITGIVDIIPPPIKCSDAAWVLRPVSFLSASAVCGTVDEAKVDTDDPMSRREAEEIIAARQDRLICGNVGFKIRHIVSLSKKDAIKAFQAKVGDTITFQRFGWGETFTHILRKVQ